MIIMRFPCACLLSKLTIVAFYNFSYVVWTFMTRMDTLKSGWTHYVYYTTTSNDAGSSIYYCFPLFSVLRLLSCILSEVSLKVSIPVTTYVDGKHLMHFRNGICVLRFFQCSVDGSEKFISQTRRKFFESQKEQICTFFFLDCKV